MRSKLLAVTSLVIVLAVSACGGSDESDLPELRPFTPEQAERLHTLRDGIAALRGLPVASGVDEGSITREAYQAYSGSGLESLSEEDRAELEFYNEIWRLMRLIGPEDDLFTDIVEGYGAGVLGFYEFDSDALVLVDDSPDGKLSLSEESTIAHEYVHSLQDARFDLSAFVEDAEPEEGVIDERSTTLDCVYEGDASLAEELYMAQEHGEDWADAEDAGGELTPEQIETFLSIPPVILDYITFNYDECARFIKAVYADGGWAKVDELYANPPLTTEQILHPEKYFAGEQAVEITDTDFAELLGEGWTRSERSAFGEFDSGALLRASGISERDSIVAADGWAGGSIAHYLHGEGTDREAVVHLSLRFDTEQDFAEFGFAFGFAIVLQGWNVSPEADHIYWYEGEDAGYALQDLETLQFDIIYSTDATAAGVAKAALQDGLAVRSE